MATELPTRTEVHKARKAELQAWCRDLDLEDEGTVAALKERLLAHLEATEAEVGEEPEELEEALVGEEAEILEEEVYAPKAKPELPPERAELLVLRRQIQDRRPPFRRQEWHRYRKLGEAWRKPRGHHSKLRRGFKYRGAMPGTGYGSPRAARGLHPSGFEEVLVHRPEDLEGLDPKTQAARIAHAVGTRKRLEIQDRADEMGVRILNRVVG